MIHFVCLSTVTSFGGHAESSVDIEGSCAAVFNFVWSLLSCFIDVEIIYATGKELKFDACKDVRNFNFFVCLKCEPVWLSAGMSVDL